MKKMLWYSLYLYGAFISAQGMQPDAQAIKAQIKQQKDALAATILSVEGGADLLKALKEIKLQFSLLSQELGISQLFNQIRTLLAQECTFVLSDALVQSYLVKFNASQQKIQEFMQSPDGQSIQELQKTLSILYQTPVLTYEQGQQAQKLEAQIQALVKEKLGPVLEEKKAVDMQISSRLAPFTEQLNKLSTQIQIIIKTDPKMAELRMKIQDFKNNPIYKWLALALIDRIDPILSALGDLYDQEDALEQPCVMVSPGTFTTPSNLFELINQATVGFLMK
jgi:hypothetical protein